MNKKFSLIACINNVFALGKDNELLYHNAEYMANFKRMTTYNVVIMGRKTFESLPNGKPLSNRFNIVITTNPKALNGKYDNLFAVNTIAEAIKLCEERFAYREWFVIGGAMLYEEFIAQGLVDTMYLTMVDDNTEGDVYFPKYVFEDDTWCPFLNASYHSNTVPMTLNVFKKKQI